MQPIQVPTAWQLNFILVNMKLENVILSLQNLVAHIGPTCLQLRSNAGYNTHWVCNSNLEQRCKHSSACSPGQQKRRRDGTKVQSSRQRWAVVTHINVGCIYVVRSRLIWHRQDNPWVVDCNWKDQAQNIQEQALHGQLKGKMHLRKYNTAYVGKI